LARNPSRSQSVTILDAGSVIPDLIRDRRDNQTSNTLFINDTAVLWVILDFIFIGMGLSAKPLDSFTWYGVNVMCCLRITLTIILLQLPGRSTADPIKIPPWWVDSDGI
jgi:hypothetical protein